MKLATVRPNGASTSVPVAVVGDLCIDLRDATRQLTSVSDVLRLGPEHVGRLRAEIDRIDGSDQDLKSRCWRLDDVSVLPPIERPGKIIMVGANYQAHRDEGAGTPAATDHGPDFPMAFSKFPSVLVGHNAAIPYPSMTRMLDYEAELGVVIGAHCKDVPASAAGDVIAGFTILNDLSMRDVQLNEMRYGLLLLGKNFDGAPCGPFLVTSDEVPNPQDLWIECRVNGDLRQREHTGSMITPIRELIAYWSQVTLEPGDIIGTGSPSGVAFARPDPEKYYLQPGDVVEVAITGLGALRNTIAVST